MTIAFDLGRKATKQTNKLNLKLFIFVGIQQVLKFEFLKFRILEVLNFHPWVSDPGTFDSSLLTRNMKRLSYSQMKPLPNAL